MLAPRKASREPSGGPLYDRRSATEAGQFGIVSDWWAAGRWHVPLLNLEATYRFAFAIKALRGACPGSQQTCPQRLGTSGGSSRLLWAGSCRRRNFETTAFMGGQFLSQNMSTCAMSKPPPPVGYKSWLDYAVATMDTRSAALDASMSDGKAAAWSRQDMERAALDELAELRRLAGRHIE